MSILEFEHAAEIYKELGMDDEVIRIRKGARNKVDQTIIQGDYIDDRDTIVKDSVINRSNIGASSDDKIARLEKIAEMKDKGIIDDDEFKQMKKEILGKWRRNLNMLQVIILILQFKINDLLIGWLL